LKSKIQQGFVSPTARGNKKIFQLKSGKNDLLTAKKMILEKKAGGEKLELDLSELDKTRDNFSF
jgi:hypothetical protein